MSPGRSCVSVAAPDGTPLGILRLPVAATNVAFYGYYVKILFVTAPPALFVVRLARPGISASGSHPLSPPQAWTTACSAGSWC